MYEWNEMSYRKFANQTMIERLRREEPEIWDREYVNGTFAKKSIQNFDNKTQKRKLGLKVEL